jgi:hypothetical protein
LRFSVVIIEKAMGFVKKTFPAMHYTGYFADTKQRFVLGRDDGK